MTIALDPQRGGAHCTCKAATHAPRLVVVTGGPGAGKTALLELARRDLCSHVAVLPEAAGILFGGGFPRRLDAGGRCAAQRAIYHVQRELETSARALSPALILCDRGTLDGIAYWPHDPDDYLRQVGTTLPAELARYAAVIHLRTPPASEYNHINPLRTESAAEAARLDARIAEAWRAHPHRFEIDHRHDFLDKLRLAMRLVRREVPACCRRVKPLAPTVADDERGEEGRP